MKLVHNCIKVNIYGNKENPALVFLHGFPFDSSMWNNQIEEFMSDYFVVTYDVRGLGDSYVGDGQYTMEAYVNDLCAVIDELGIEKPIICGLSMGGYIALRAVEREKDRFKALILCDTKTEADDDTAKLSRADAINLINVEGLASYANKFIPKCFCEKSIKEMPEVLEDLINKASRQNKVGVKAAVLAMLSRTDTTKALKKIDMPTLIICGAQDEISPSEKMEELSEKITNAVFKKIPKAGHLPAIENPEAFNKAIKAFLKKVK
ncbi:MAG: alpha/beta fold hydrolase [Melioribacteraceae bacterium]|nr:alpha/beta fold hydrolase [Melioribacteraceae bacterium]